MTSESHNTNPIKTTKPRRWFRFRLRTLLVLVTLISVPLGWAGWDLDQRRREKAAIAWVREMGGEGYNGFSSFQFHLVVALFPDERSWCEKTTDKWFGERVRFVSLYATQVSDLSPLAELKNLEILFLNETQVSDLSLLTELNNLEFLNLDATQVSDLSPLAELKNLKQLYLRSTLVSEEQVEELRLALTNCEILILDK